MSTRHNKQTARGRPPDHDGRSCALQTPLPIGSFPVDINCPDDEPHLRRIVEVSNEIIDAAWKEIQCLEITGYKKKTRYTHQLMKVLKAHLPDALKELHTICKVEIANQKEITRYKDAYDEINAENKKMRKHEQALVREKDNLRQEIARIHEKPTSKRKCLFDTRKRTAEQTNVHFEMMLSENKWLGEQLLKERESARESLDKAYKTESHYISINKTLEQDLKKKHEKIQNLFAITQKQKEEIIKCKIDHHAQNKTFQEELEKISQYKKVLPGMIPKQNHNELNNADHNQSVSIEKYKKLKTNFDTLLHENSKIKEELGLEKEISNIKEANIEKLKSTSDAREQEILKLKKEIATQNEPQVTFETLKKKTYKLYQENQTLKGRLEQEKANLEKQAKVSDQLTLDLQEQKREHIKEINTLKTSFDMKLSEKNIQHKHELDRIRQDINSHGDRNLQFEMEKLLQEKQQRESIEESIKRDLNDQIQKLQNEVKHLQIENKKVLQAFELEKKNIKMRNDNHDKTFQDLKEKHALEIKNITATLEKQQTLHENLQKEKDEQERYKHQESLMQVKEHARNQEDECKNLRLEIQKLNELKAKEKADIKMEYKKQQNDLCNEIEIVRKEKLQLLLNNRTLNDDLRRERDNVKEKTKENQSLIEDLQQLRDKQNETIGILESAEDCQRKINAENLELKNEVVLLRREKLELKKEFVHEKENARQEEEKEKSSLNHKIHKLLEENAIIQKERSELNVSLQQIIEKQKNEIAELRSVNKKLQNDERRHNTDSRVVETYAGNNELQQQLVNMRIQLENKQQELEETKSRLSRFMGDKLTDNNPNIADLSDRNRPTKIAERYQEFYDNQWTDAFEIVDGNIGNDEKTIETLKGILLETMAFANAESAYQMTAITETLSKGKDLPASTMKQLKDLRKSTSETYGMGLYTEYWKKLNQSESQRAKMATRIPLFVKECFEICWLMAVQDPPVAIGPEIDRNARFNKDYYKAYTRSGDRLDYVVWPVLLLHQDGPVLCKGVAQCY